MAVLKDFLPHEFMSCEYDKTLSRKHAEVEIVEEHGLDSDVPWPGPHKNVNVWCKLANGKAVGWNESPSHGWSFPVIKL